jgi:DeoR/GlpR family transcriptional regulator of sugar metabolism
MSVMLAEQRRLKILELLQEEGSARVKTLSEMFSVSEPTVRQDLQTLEEKGYIKEHGGAFLKSVPQQVRTLSLQHLENLEKKILIGMKAADFVDNGDSIILDSGSTVTEIAKHLTRKRDIRIVTNALNIALLLGAEHGFEVLMTGGEFKPPTLSLTGEKAAGFFHQIHVNKLFLATGGVSPEGNLTYPGLSDLPVKQAMIESASTVYLVADSTKFGRTAFATLGGIELVDYLITDAGISPETSKFIEERGVRIIIADKSSSDQV